MYDCIFCADFFMFMWCFREDKGDQILDYKQEIQTMEEQLKKLHKEVKTASFICRREENIVALDTQEDCIRHKI